MNKEDHTIPNCVVIPNKCVCPVWWHEEFPTLSVVAKHRRFLTPTFLPTPGFGMTPVFLG